MKIRSAKKLKKSSEEVADDDRISHVPDEVLLHILSFIPTLDSIAFCMLLSKRWEHLWKHVPKLTFDDTLKIRNRKSHYAKFAIFVNNVWSLHDPDALQKLSLCLYENHALYDVENWIAKSITRNIQSLDLTIRNYSWDVLDQLPVRLPSDLFTCKTLEALVLIGTKGNIWVDFPKVVCLPKLKTMKLVGLKYHDDERDCSGKLIRACPSLESLFVEDTTCADAYIGFHTIYSSTLRDIEILLWKKPCLIGYNPTIFCSALRRLNLSIPDPDYRAKDIRVPSNVFSCNTLEQLVLRGVYVTCDSRIICLPNLTVLALHRVEFEDDEFFSRLISSCPSLESVAVMNIMKSELSISSCTLNVLEVDLYCGIEPGHKLVISAPALKCLKLKLSNSGYVDYHIENLAALEQADIGIDFAWPRNSDPSEYCSSALTKAFQALRHVKSLKVYHKQDSSADVGVDHGLPMFNRLTELDITIDSWLGYCLFQKLIMNSTKLEKLTFGLKHEVSYDDKWRNLNIVPACSLSSLKCVSISSFRGQEAELAMINYILGIAKILEKIEVCFSQYHPLKKAKKSQLCKKIMSLRPRLEKCEVVFIE